MAQRLITAGVLIAVTVLLVAIGGPAMALAALLGVGIGLWEEQRALLAAGHKLCRWPAWLGLVLCMPLSMYLGAPAVLPFGALLCGLCIMMVLFRAKPNLEDMLFSILPVISLVVPGMCVMTMAAIQPMPLQQCLFVLMCAVPLMGDTFAFLVGSRIGGPKLCPAVSPHKTVSGAVGGLVGSLLGAFLTRLVFLMIGGPEAQALMPGFLPLLLLGLLGGVAGQMGDLFASLIKRHCGIKDFSNLFPGHGGMIDRLDSIYFMVFVIFTYTLL